jgi:hypothetical protein
VVHEVDDARRRGAVLAAEDAVAEPEVQRGADNDDEVGLGEGGRARSRDEQRVTRGEHAAAHAGGDRRQPDRLDEAASGVLGAIAPHVAGDHHDGVRCVAQQRRDGREVVGVRRPVGSGAGHGHRRGDRGVEHVHGHVEEDRSPVRGHRQVEGRARTLPDLLASDRRGGLGHRREQRLVEP